MLSVQIPLPELVGQGLFPRKEMSVVSLSENISFQFSAEHDHIYGLFAAMFIVKINKIYSKAFHNPGVNL